MFIGIAMFFVLMLMGGLIAFLGDKIGSKVGKKFVKLFGLWIMRISFQKGKFCLMENPVILLQILWRENSTWEKISAYDLFD